MDVAPAGDRRRVPEPVRRQAHGLDHDVPSRSSLRGTLGIPERAVGEDRAGPGPEVLGADVGPRDLAQVGVDVVGADVVRARRPDRRTGRAPDRAGPGSAGRARPGVGRAGRPRPGGRTCRGTGSGSRSRSPGRAETRSVVRPKERLSRAYSSLPTRMSVVSRSRTTAARTFSRARPGRARSRSTRARMRGRTRAKLDQPRRTCRRRGGPASARGSGTACGRGRRARSPGDGRSVTGRSTRRSRRAGWRGGGSAPGSSASRMRPPSGARYENPRPDRRREIPGRASVA